MNLLVVMFSKLPYEEILEFLDNVPSINFPEEIQEFLIEMDKHISTESIRDIIEDKAIY